VLVNLVNLIDYRLTGTEVRRFANYDEFWKYTSKGPEVSTKCSEAVRVHRDVTEDAVSFRATPKRCTIDNWIGWSSCCGDVLKVLSIYDGVPIQIDES
jgi:hypothetical protein